MLARVFGSRSASQRCGRSGRGTAARSRASSSSPGGASAAIGSPCISGVVVVLFYLLAAFADFFATMDPHDTDARRTYAPPQSIRFFDDDWSLRPHVIGAARPARSAHLPHGPRPGHQGRSGAVRRRLSVRAVRPVPDQYPSHRPEEPAAGRNAAPARHRPARPRSVVAPRCGDARVAHHRPRQRRRSACSSACCSAAYRRSTAAWSTPSSSA